MSKKNQLHTYNSIYIYFTRNATKVAQPEYCDTTGPNGKWTLKVALKWMSLRKYLKLAFYTQIGLKYLQFCATCVWVRLSVYATQNQ